MAARNGNMNIVEILLDRGIIEILRLIMILLFIIYNHVNFIFHISLHYLQNMETYRNRH